MHSRKAAKEEVCVIVWNDKGEIVLSYSFPVAIYFFSIPFFFCLSLSPSLSRKRKLSAKWNSNLEFALLLLFFMVCKDVRLSIKLFYQL